jgi:hypothetical protein
LTALIRRRSATTPVFAVANRGVHLEDLRLAAAKGSSRLRGPVDRCRVSISPALCRIGALVPFAERTWWN